MRRAILTLAGGMICLSACHSSPVPRSSATPAAAVPSVDVPVPPEPPVAGDEGSASVNRVPPGEVQNFPPCLPEVSTPITTVKRRTKSARESAKPESAELPGPPSAASAADVGVKSIDVSVASVLGKKVEGANGEDLGRVVDIQADSTGRVRLVIIEFGGFLGVGNRRAAVDWSLLRFHPDDQDRPMTLNVSVKTLQTTPEYRQSPRPQALMAPVPSAPAPQSK
jgi:hypothetical protein